MKRIREYRIINGVLYCKTVFIPEGDNVDLPMSLTMTAALYPDKPAKWLTISADMDIPMKLRIEENRFFMDLLTQMFYA